MVDGVFEKWLLLLQKQRNCWQTYCVVYGQEQHTFCAFVPLLIRAGHFQSGSAHIFGIQSGAWARYVGHQFASLKSIANDGKAFTTGDSCVKS